MTIDQDLYAKNVLDDPSSQQSKAWPVPSLAISMQTLSALSQPLAPSPHVRCSSGQKGHRGDVTVVGRNTKGLRVKFKDDATIREYTVLLLGEINKQEARLDAYHQETAQKILSRL